ncbi:hypothetical protein D3C73_855770 [compost metagenome]
MHGGIERDLDIDLDVGRVDAGGIVDRIGIAASARKRIGNAALLSDTEIGALADHLGAHLARRDADRVIGTIADFRIRFDSCTNIGADAAEPEKIGFTLQDRRHDFEWRGRRLVQPDGRGRLFGQLYRLFRAGNDHRAFRQGAAIIILPTGPRQGEHAVALPEGLFGIRIRIDEDVAVIERSDQADFWREQHAVAEDVAGHVTDADDVERRRLDVDIHFTEVALDGFPCAAGGDAHLLVVVTCRSAGGECVIEPEAGFLCQAIGGVGEGCGALVGGYDEIGVVTIDADRVLRSDDLALDNVIGDRQKRADIGLVGFLAGIEDFITRATCWQHFREEAALCADRHDNGVLHLLGLDQAKHFGPVILAAIRPAQAAAGDLAET